MADNVGISTGSDATVAADDIGGVLYQRVKLAVGADGAASDLAPGQATMAASVPVVIASNQTAVPVSDGGGSLTVDVGSIVPGTGATNLGKAEDAAHNSGDVGVMALGVYNFDPFALGQEGDYGPLQLNSSGALYVSVADQVSIASIAEGQTNIGDVDVLTVPADPFGANADAASATGSISAKLRHLAASGLAGMTTLPTGSNAIGKLAANSGVDIGDVDVTSGPTGASAFQVQGTVAHDSPAANNPVLNAGYAVNAEPAAVANADVARLITDLVGKLITLPYANPENFISGKTSDITGTSDTAVIAAQGAGVRIYVTHLIVTNSHATVGTFVLIKDGSTEIYNGYAAAAGGGFSITLPVPLRLTANTPLNVACATTGSNVRASASGYKGI